MTLADTSVWVDYLRRGDPVLAQMLQRRRVATHSAVIGELACGNLRQREIILADLAALPRAVEASAEEALGLIERQKLHGLGLGWIDVQLIASALLSDCRLWTKDKRMEESARNSGVETGPPEPDCS